MGTGTDREVPGGTRRNAEAERRRAGATGLTATRPLGSPGLAPFTFDRTFVFPVPPGRLWEALTATDEFPRWWPWLRRLDGDGLVPGGRAECEVRAPVPYALRFTVEVCDIVSGQRVETWVSGDLRGPARLEVGPHPEGAWARLAWEVELRHRLLRPLAGVARPVMEWGHDWVVGTGVDQFRRRALRV